jgi:hypothetical protein
MDFLGDPAINRSLGDGISIGLLLLHLTTLPQLYRTSVQCPLAVVVHLVCTLYQHVAPCMLHDRS